MRSIPLTSIALLGLSIAVATACSGGDGGTDAGVPSDAGETDSGAGFHDGELTRESLMVDGYERFFTILVPRHDARSALLRTVLVLHGGGGTGDGLAQSDKGRIAAYRGSGYRDAAHQDPVMLVYPDADLDSMQYPDTADRHWNDFRPESDDGIDDVRFLLMLADHMVAEHRADPEATVLTGASNGGMMTMRVACSPNDAFVAYAPVIANEPVAVSTEDLCGMSQAAPLLFIHGRADTLFMPFGGGTIASGPGMGLGGEVISADATVASFQERLGAACGTGTVTSLDTVSDGTEPIATDFVCARARLRHIVIDGAGHSPPSTVGTADAPLAVRPSRDFDWLDEVVRFTWSG